MDLARHLLDRFGRWRFVALTLLVIFAVSSIPNYLVVTEPSRWPIDKVVHFTEYAVLAALIVGAACRQPRTSIRLAAIVLLAIVLASLYGVTDEIHQRYVHGRDPDWRDWTADVLGSATGALAAAILLRRRRDAP
jgi:VanZ family protein